MEDKIPVLLKDLGSRFPTKSSKKKTRYGLYLCGYCDKEFESSINHIKNGSTKSCGCQKNKITHGLRYNKFYGVWKDMRGRCCNLKHKSYPEYGGRGILLCNDWQDVVKFVAWAESTYIEGMSLDRIDNDGNYEPDNCRWADKTTQAINQRIQKNNTSGFAGINWYKAKSKWRARITINKSTINLGYFEDIQDAVKARDTFIIENNLTHKLSTKIHIKTT